MVKDVLELRLSIERFSLNVCKEVAYKRKLAFGKADGFIMAFLENLAQGLKRLNEIKGDLSELELKESLLAQKALLLDAKEEILSLRDKNIQLEEKIKTLNDATKRASELIEVEGFKYDRGGKDKQQPIGLPYCPVCEVKEDGRF
jgi:hypothetical protein